MLGNLANNVRGKQNIIRGNLANNVRGKQSIVSGNLPNNVLGNLANNVRGKRTIIRGNYESMWIIYWIIQQDWIEYNLGRYPRGWSARGLGKDKITGPIVQRDSEE